MMRTRGGPGKTALLAAALVAGTLAIVVPAGPGGADGNEAPGAPTAFRRLSAGREHTCAVTQSGSAFCWGINDDGQLGLGDTATRGDGSGQMGSALPPVALGTGRRVVALGTGREHTCAILDNGQVKCWGRAAIGQLGYGDDDIRGDGPGEMGNNLPAVPLGTGRTATAITGGGEHTCALLDNGRVKCWGLNGVLGLGDDVRRGDGPGEMGNNLPAVPLGTGRTATAITAGERHTCALLDNGKIKCWGQNPNGQLGLGDMTDRGDGPGEMGNNLPAVSLGTGRTATAITAGERHTCALLDNGKVKCWGNNTVGRLGLGDSQSRGDGLGEMGDALPPVDLGTGRSAVSVAAGNATTCALLDNDQVRCWGVGGVLGLGDPQTRGDGPGEMGDALPPVDLGNGAPARAVTVGGQHSCALLQSNRIRCWGVNDEGQLGLGDTADRGDQPGEMGTALPLVGVTIVSCGGRTVTVDVSRGESPTAGADVVLGTPGTDLINAGNGHDTLCGRGGNDTLDGGNGNDRLFGEDGEDTLRGQSGDDALDAGAGNDRLEGGPQRDSCNGRTGTDTQSGCEVRSSIP